VCSEFCIVKHNGIGSQSTFSQAAGNECCFSGNMLKEIGVVIALVRWENWTNVAMRISQIHCMEVHASCYK
jgi:hypothetical protein